MNRELLAGVDEVGRGPLAGDVVAAAVILDPLRPIDGLRDSKKLTERRREELDPLIKDQALAWAIGRAAVSEIDQLNILKATMLAMQRAIEALGLPPDRAIIDGNRVPELLCPAQSLIKGDQKVDAIMAASIIAKVCRDSEMRDLDLLYPGYGFARHKGYGTREHLAALAKLGPCAIHRVSFAPVRRLIGSPAH